jgi:hypothetical protein
VEEMALADGGYKNIVEAVVIVISDCDSKSEKRNVEARLLRDVGESSVAVIVIELQRGRAFFGVPRPILGVDQQYVGEAIVVVIDESAARAHGFRQPLFSERPVVVGEVDAGLSGDVVEGYVILRKAGWGEQEK